MRRRLRIGMVGCQKRYYLACSRAREVSYGNSIKLELIAFHQAVKGESEAVTPDLDDLRDAALCRAVVASARSGPPLPGPTDVGVHDGGMR